MQAAAENPEQLSLGNLADGAADELFEQSLKRVIRNVKDTKTSPTDERTITLTIKIKPDDQRDIADVSVECKEKLASAKAQSGMVRFEKAKAFPHMVQGNLGLAPTDGDDPA